MSEQTTNANANPHTVVFPITLFARVLAGSEGTFIVTATPPKPGEDAPGVAVRPITKIDDNGEGSPIAAALLREVSELHADAALRINADSTADNDDSTAADVSDSADVDPGGISVFDNDDVSADVDPDDDITEDAGEA